MSNTNQEVTRHDLKNNALLERIAGLENDKADLRVDLTIYANEVQRLQARVEELEALVPKEEANDSADSSD